RSSLTTGTAERIVYTDTGGPGLGPPVFCFPESFMYPCGRRIHSLTRRQMLLRCANGFGAAALATLLQETQGADVPRSPDPFAPKKPHFAAKAKSVIFLFMDGGPSQVDTFDPKPVLQKYHGKPFPAKVEPTQFNNVGNTLASPWKFKQYGQSGLPVS